LTSLFSSFNFFASGTGIILTCAVAAAMILLWDWRASLIGLIVVQFGAAAVALQTGQIEAQLMIVQVCIIALCTLILAISIAQAPRSPTISQSGNWIMRLLMLILVYTALRLFDFNFSLPFPNAIEASDALRMTVFFIWISICALLTLGLSNSPLFTGVALLLWCVPAHVFATLLLPESGVSVLIGIVELLIALGCSYLILTESLSIKQRPIVSTDITFPVEGRRMLTDSSMVPIGEMTTMDIPTVPLTAEARQAMTGVTLPQTAPRGTILSDTNLTDEPLRINRAQAAQSRAAQSGAKQSQKNQSQINQMQANLSPSDSSQSHPRRETLTPGTPTQANPTQADPTQADPRQADPTQNNQKWVRSGSPLTRTNLKAAQKPLTDSLPSRQVDQSSPDQSSPDQSSPDQSSPDQSSPDQSLPNQLAEELQEPTQPTPNLFGTSTHLDKGYINSKAEPQQKSKKEKTGLSRLFNRRQKDETDLPKDR